MVIGYFFFGFHLPLPILFLVNFFPPYIFPSINKKDTHITVPMENINIKGKPGKVK